MAARAINKLVGWKAEFLSFAGRTILVKSVLAATPTYVMQGAALLTHLYDKLDKKNRDFVWGTTQERKRMHSVVWSKITRVKEEGGLGIHATKARNLALLAKLNWRLYMEKDALWAKVILNKYCSQTRSKSKDLDKLPFSITWKAIKHGFPVFAKGICWNVGRNSKLNF